MTKEHLPADLMKRIENARVLYAGHVGALSLAEMDRVALYAEIERLNAKIASLDDVIDYWKCRAGDVTASEPRAAQLVDGCQKCGGLFHKTEECNAGIALKSNARPVCNTCKTPMRLVETDYGPGWQLACTGHDGGPERTNPQHLENNDGT